jgi:AcrR family transcriptional regulator
MNTGTPPRTADGARLGTALTRRAAINAATQAYLRGEAVDMSALAAQLGIGRSTLYRLVGNRDDLLGVVLAEATERTFRRAAAGAAPEGGVDLVLDVINRFMHAVIDAEPLQALCQREPSERLCPQTHVLAWVRDERPMEDPPRRPRLG